MDVEVKEKFIVIFLKLRIPIKHPQFFRKLSQNHDYIQTFCNDRRNPFHFACRQWFLFNNPQRCCSILIIPTRILVFIP